MDSLQKQVIALSHKIDGLYTMMEQLNQTVTDASTKDEAEFVHRSPYSLGSSNNRYSYHSSSLNAGMEHKDVLLDSNCVDSHSQSSEKELSPEIQIKRLTAQLTAAYNRIAALEEQLLRERIHS